MKRTVNLKAKTLPDVRSDRITIQLNFLASGDAAGKYQMVFGYRKILFKRGLCDTSWNDTHAIWGDCREDKMDLNDN